MAGPSTGGSSQGLWPSFTRHPRGCGRPAMAYDRGRGPTPWWPATPQGGRLPCSRAPAGSTADGLLAAPSAYLRRLGRGCLAPRRPGLTSALDLRRFIRAGHDMLPSPRSHTKAIGRPARHCLRLNPRRATAPAKGSVPLEGFLKRRSPKSSGRTGLAHWRPDLPGIPCPGAGTPSL